MLEKILNFTLILVIAATFVASQTEMICNDENNGRHFPSGVNCSAYITCFNGNFFVQNCPSPFYFNFNTQSCDWPGNVQCVLVPGGTECTESNNGRHFPTNWNCSSYFTCYHGLFFLQDCPNPFWFDYGRQVCDLPQNVNCALAQTTTTPPPPPPTTPTTTTTTTTTTPTTTTTTTLSTTTQSPSEIICPSSGVSKMPNLFSCTRYFLCFDGTPVERTCSPGLFFSRSQLRCVRREESDCDLEMNLCPDVNDPNNIIFLANQEDCRQYFICYDGQPKELDCGPRMHWDSVHNWCIPAENSTCVPSYVLPDIREITCPIESMNNIQFLPHPVDCRFYFICFNMQSTLVRCANRTLFDYILGGCALADQARCYAG